MFSSYAETREAVAAPCPAELLPALALVETPMDFCGLSLGGCICKFGAAREHSRMIWVCFNGEADPHHRIPEWAVFVGRIRAVRADVAHAGAVPMIIALEIAG